MGKINIIQKKHFFNFNSFLSLDLLSIQKSNLFIDFKIIGDKLFTTCNMNNKLNKEIFLSLEFKSFFNELILFFKENNIGVTEFKTVDFSYENYKYKYNDIAHLMNIDDKFVYKQTLVNIWPQFYKFILDEDNKCIYIYYDMQSEEITEITNKSLQNDIENFFIHKV